MLQTGNLKSLILNEYEHQDMQKSITLDLT